MKPLLQIKDLTVHFQTEDSEVVALQNINLNLDYATTLALVGESGSGKSVCAMTIMGLIPSPPLKIVSGKILFQTKNGKQIDLLHCSKHELESYRGREISMIFQEPMTSLNPLMTCGNQVIEVIKSRHNSEEEARKETIQLFADVKLPNPKEIIDRYPHEISGGQKQRVMIAMAIACKPQLLIADEPTTALDVSVQKSILELLHELQAKYKMSILFITHDLGLVQHFANNVDVLYRSKLVEQDSVHNIFKHPKESYTQGLLACKPSIKQRVKKLKTLQEYIGNRQIESPSNNNISQDEYQHKIQELNKKKPLLEIRGLKVWYPTKNNFFGRPIDWYKAVDGVNLSVRSGETLGLVGESGCGKTTIGKAIVMLNKITEGSICYKSKNIEDFSKHEVKEYKRKVQLIFQDPYSSLNPRISIGQAIQEPMEVHSILSSNQRKLKVEELLEKVGLLPSHYARYPHEFSGGQRQRICIARTLALQPELLVCDESVSALDVSVQAQVLNLLTNLREEFNLSYLFISHDLGVIKHISDHVAVMQKGLIVEYQDSESLFKKPLNKYTIDLMQNSFLE